MYVCSCNIMTDEKWREAAKVVHEKGVPPDLHKNLVAVWKEVGARPVCGGCRPTLERILQEVAQAAVGL